MTPDALSQAFKQMALKEGFDACGIARAGRLDEWDAPLKQWIQQGMHGEMSYMARNQEMRLDPRLLHPGTRSVIMLAKNYYPSAHFHRPLGWKQTKNLQQPTGHCDSEALKAEEPRPKVSVYAYGKDYHPIIRAQLSRLIKWLHEYLPESSSRGFTDSAPLAERQWAIRAGLGFTGKNQCLIIPRKGSFYFLAAILTTAELEPDTPYSHKHCGSCRRCLEACPTGALKEDNCLDARRCLSYLSIEHKGIMPEAFKDKTKNWIFGCDICQEVCPHNRFARPHSEPDFAPLEPLKTWKPDDWQNMSPQRFSSAFKKTGSALARTGYAKLSEMISLIKT